MFVYSPVLPLIDNGFELPVEKGYDQHVAELSSQLALAATRALEECYVWGRKDLSPGHLLVYNAESWHTLGMCYQASCATLLHFHRNYTGCYEVVSGLIRSKRIENFTHHTEMFVSDGKNVLLICPANIVYLKEMSEKVGIESVCDVKVFCEGEILERNIAAMQVYLEQTYPGDWSICLSAKRAITRMFKSGTTRIEGQQKHQRLVYRELVKNQRGEPTFYLQSVDLNEITANF